MDDEAEGFLRPARAELASIVAAMNGQGAKVSARIERIVPSGYYLIFADYGNRGVLKSESRYFMISAHTAVPQHEWSALMRQAMQRGWTDRHSLWPPMVPASVLFSADLHGITGDDLRALAAGWRAMEA